MRLDKALVQMGVCTRSEAKKLCRKGTVRINQTIANKSDEKVEEGDEITIYDQTYTFHQYVYIMLHKPKGVISATEGNDVTVIDLIEQPYKDIFPVGRLDKDTTGLLLLTNNGALAHNLLSPKQHVEKEYIVTLRNPVTKDTIDKIAKGIQDGEDTFLPATYTPIKDNEGTIILQEGKYHEIKRMFAKCDNEVISLKRIRMKNLRLDERLDEGEYRYLTDEEVTELGA